MESLTATPRTTYPNNSNTPTSAPSGNPKVADIQPKVVAENSDHLKDSINTSIDQRTIVILRGMPGSGKSYHADNKMPYPHVIIGADRLAAEREAINSKTTLTSANIKELANAYYKHSNATTEGSYSGNRKEVITGLHTEVQHRLADILEANPRNVNVVVDNTSICQWEVDTYFKIGAKHSIPESKITTLDINPFDNPKFRSALTEVMQQKEMELVPNSKQWPYLEFQSIATGEIFNMRSDEGNNIVCEALNKVLLEPLPLQYMKQRLTSYLNSLSSNSGASSHNWRNNTTPQVERAYSRAPAFSNWRDRSQQHSEPRPRVASRSPRTYSGATAYPEWRNENARFQPKPKHGSDSLNWRKP